jgi:hypothetical protein
MIKLVFKFMLVIAVAFCLVPGALAGNFTLTDVGSSAGGTVLAGIYTAPYIATIDGQTGIEVICDDFDTETTLGQSWNAVGTAVNTITSSSPVKFASGYAFVGDIDDPNAVTAGDVTGVTQEEAYAMAAYLAVELLNASTPTQAGILNYAIWSIFDNSPTTPIGQLLSKNVSDSTITQVKAAWNLARTNALPIGQYSNVTIWTPVTSPLNPLGKDEAQEFITVRVPEPATLAMILVDLLAVGGLMLFVRRRKAGALT